MWSHPTSLPEQICDVEDVLGLAPPSETIATLPPGSARARTPATHPSYLLHFRGDSSTPAGGSSMVRVASGGGRASREAVPAATTTPVAHGVSASPGYAMPGLDVQAASEQRSLALLDEQIDVAGGGASLSALDAVDLDVDESDTL